eukprot:14053007-Alexandrium_andersonii.AAC.1
MATEAVPTPSAVPFTMPANPASPELSAMFLRVVDQCLIVRTPRRQTAPHVDRRVRRPPAKTVSTKARTPTPLILPREVIDRAGLQYHVSDQPQES